MTEQNTNQPPPSAPPQGQMYFPPQYAPEDEIDLRELFGVLWKGKWWIIGITAIFAVASVFYALFLPNEYKATAIVMSASSDAGSSLSRAAGQLGGLASLAGINLGSGESNEAGVAIEIIKTWAFQEEFIQKYSLQVPIFAAKGWDQTRNELILDDGLYDIDKQEWIRKAPKGKTVKPTSWELHEEFSKHLSISEDKDSGLVRISYVHYSPEYTQKITSWLVDDINALMKKKALSDATKNINYLEDQISKTSLSGMQEVFYTLVEEQIKTKMLADVSDEYVFKFVSRSKIPEEKFKPKRALIVIFGLLLGGLLGVIFILIKAMRRN